MKQTWNKVGTDVELHPVLYLQSPEMDRTRTIASPFFFFDGRKYPCARVTNTFGGLPRPKQNGRYRAPFIAGIYISTFGVYRKNSGVPTEKANSDLTFVAFRVMNGIPKTRRYAA